MIIEFFDGQMVPCQIIDNSGEPIGNVRWNALHGDFFPKGYVEAVFDEIDRLEFQAFDPCI